VRHYVLLAAVCAWSERDAEWKGVRVFGLPYEPLLAQVDSGFNGGITPLCRETLRTPTPKVWRSSLVNAVAALRMNPVIFGAFVGRPRRSPGPKA
jgi:hypothetical protein